MSDKGLRPGRDADGAKSTLYCHLCYDDGLFLQPDIKLSSMQHLVMHALERDRWPRPLAWVATRHIARLRRWR